VGSLDELIRRAADLEGVETDDGRARLADLVCLDSGFLSAFLQAAARAQAGEVVSFPLPPGRDLADLLMRVGGALPPRLRLGVRWILRLTEGTEVSFVVRVASTAQRPDLEPRVERYRAWIQYALDAASTSSLRRITGDWEIRSWDHLMESLS
jgi:hypothetical protein